MKIPPTIEPIAHISPYRRIDPSPPGRKRVITLDEWQASGSVGRLRRKLGGCDTRPFAPAVQIIQHEPAAAQTSTDKIRAAIDRIRGKPLPQPESGDPDKLS